MSLIMSVTHPKIVLVFLLFLLFFIDTWLGNCSVVFSPGILAFRLLEEECHRQTHLWLQYSVWCSGSTELEEREHLAPSLFAERRLVHEESTCFVQISAQLFTNRRPRANFVISLNQLLVVCGSAFKTHTHTKKPHVFPKEEQGFS